MMYITIMVVALFASITILGYRYLGHYSEIEAVYDAQLDDISILAANFKDKINVYNMANDEDKYKFRPLDREIEDFVNAIYKISTRGYESDK